MYTAGMSDRACRAPASTRARGFTLIEVLVVVAIISLLAAVLLPSLARARAQAKAAACTANLHHIGNGSIAYAHTYRDYFPLTASEDDDNWYALWKARLLANVNSLICPGTRNVIRPETLRWDVAHRNGPEKDKVAYLIDPAGSGRSGDICRIARSRDDSTGGHSYEYTGVYGGGANDPWRPLAGLHRRSKHFEAYLSEIALAWDADESQGSPPGRDAGCRPTLGGGDDCPQPWDNHGEAGTNFLFGDGHAQWVKKFPGDWVDMTAGSINTAFQFGQTASPKTSVAVLIDMIHSRSWEPWYYYRQ